MRDGHLCTVKMAPHSKEALARAAQRRRRADGTNGSGNGAWGAAPQHRALARRRLRFPTAPGVAAPNSNWRAVSRRKAAPFRPPYLLLIASLRHSLFPAEQSVITPCRLLACVALMFMPGTGIPFMIFGGGFPDHVLAPGPQMAQASQPPYYPPPYQPVAQPVATQPR